MSLENAIIYCEQKIAPPGNDWYYALRKAPQKPLLLALLALDQEWKNILALRHEPSLAIAKFSWWREELHHAFTEVNPQHPITQLLIAENFQQKISLEKLLQIYVDKIQPVFYAREKEWLQQPILAHNIYQIILDLRNTHENLRILSEAFFFSDAIIHLREYLIQGEIPFAQETLEKFSVNVEKLQAQVTTEALKKLLAHINSLAEKNFRLVLSNKNLPCFFRQYTKLQLKLLEEITQADFPVLTHRITLTPIRKLLLCWFTK